MAVEHTPITNENFDALVLGFAKNHVSWYNGEGKSLNIEEDELVDVVVDETADILFHIAGVSENGELPRPKGRGFLLRDITSRSQNF